MSWAIWITGPPGSGKSVLAGKTAAALAARGEPVKVLELDALRKLLTPIPTYSESERAVVYRALVYFAATLADAGIPVIIDATAHRRAWRDLARAVIPRFAEIQLTCPLAVCRERERRRAPGHAPPGIYAGAGQPGATVPGVNVPYEAALNPELTVDTAAEAPDVALASIVRVARELATSDAQRPTPPVRPGWALWITGMPGSGKTTLATAVAEALAARGLSARLLTLDQLRDFVLQAGPHFTADEIVHRALVCAAKLLTEAGIAVIIDATAPRRRWRELARELIAQYAEVQLVCPPEVCGTRERAGRWTPTSWICGGARPFLTRAPDIVLDYEASLNPDLIVYTDLTTAWSATDKIVMLADRLQHRTGGPPCTSAIS